MEFIEEISSSSIQLRVVFKSRFKFGGYMHRLRGIVFFFSILFLLQPYASISFEPSEEISQEVDTYNSPRSVEDAKPWTLFQEPIESETTIMEPNGLVSLASVQFDPVTQVEPTATIFSRANDGEFTGLYLLQLNQRNGEILERLQTTHEFTPLEFISNEVWLVRAPQDSTSFIDELSSDEDVRWIGSMQPEWRLHPDVLDARLSSIEVLNFVPAPDVSDDGMNSLVVDLLSSGATAVMCGTTFCTLSTDSMSYHQVLKRIAYDGRIIWTELGFNLEVHNANAVSIAGVQGVINNATFTLDGTGETIAITDTGLDRDHPDIDGRVIAIYTQFGLDSSPADKNTGHGTHIALTVLGDGTNDSSVKGVAPGAQLVMYALEHDPTGVFGRLGSIYDMLKDAETATARVAVNAWG